MQKPNRKPQKPNSNKNGQAQSETQTICSAGLTKCFPYHRSPSKNLRKLKRVLRNKTQKLQQEMSCTSPTRNKKINPASSTKQNSLRPPPLKQKTAKARKTILAQHENLSEIRIEPTKIRTQPPQNLDLGQVGSGLLILGPIRITSPGSPRS